MRIKRKIRAIRNLFITAVTFAILFGIMIMFQKYSAQFPIKLVFGVGFIQYLFFIIFVRRIRLSIKFEKKYVIKDESVIANIKVKKRSIYPFKKLEIYVKYKSKYRLEVFRRVVCIELGDAGEQAAEMVLENLPCGYTEFEIEQAYAYDIFGMKSVAVKAKDNKTNLIVMPTPRPINIELPRIPYISGDESEIFIEEKGKDNSELYEIREFREGDSLNRIHWKLSSKTDDLIIRDSVSSIDTNIYVYFDLCQNVNLDDKFENAVSIAYELRDRGYAFYIMWIDAKTHILRRSLVSEYEHIEQTVAEIMSYELYEKDDDVIKKLDRFMNENHEVYNLFILS